MIDSLKHCASHNPTDSASRSILQPHFMGENAKAPGVGELINKVTYLIVTDSKLESSD